MTKLLLFCPCLCGCIGFTQLKSIILDKFSLQGTFMHELSETNKEQEPALCHTGISVTNSNDCAMKEGSGKKVCFRDPKDRRYGRFVGW